MCIIYTLSKTCILNVSDTIDCNDHKNFGNFDSINNWQAISNKACYDLLAVPF